jgi:hypothetical protein
VNIASALPTSRFTALLIEGDRPLGIEPSLRDEGCSIRKVSNRLAAIESMAGSDLVVIGSPSFSDDEVLELIGKASGAPVLVVTQKSELGVRAAGAGASVVAGESTELVTAQLKQLVSLVELKRRVVRAGSPSGVFASPASGFVQRRSAPLPKEATPDAIDALVEAAEGLVPMHKFQRAYVDYALRRFGGNKVHTAAALGIDRRTIQRWARARLDQRVQGIAQPSSSSTPSTSS